MRNLYLMLAFCFSFSAANATLVFLPAPYYTPPEGTLIQGVEYEFKFANLTASFPSPPTYGTFAAGTTANVTIDGFTVQVMSQSLSADSYQLSITIKIIDGPNGTSPALLEFSTTDPAAASFNYSTSALPIELSKFEADSYDNAVELNWETATENDNDFFSVERSFNGRDFVEIGTIDGNGSKLTTSNYTFVDEDVRTAATSNLVYYRLKNTDYDGDSQYSDIVQVTLKSKGFQIGQVNAYQSFTTIENGDAETDAVLSIMNMQGQIFEVKNIVLFNGFNQIDLNLYNLPMGTYVVSIQNGNAQIAKQFVKF